MARQRNTRITIITSDELKDRVEALALEQRRSISRMAELLIIDQLDELDRRNPVAAARRTLMGDPA